jgi:2-dehydropantoate 2-reductase
VLLGFPGTAAVTHDHRIRYLILSTLEQPTTIGELDGSRSPRIKVIGGVLEKAGFPVAISPNMDAWLKTHVAEIVPTACALYMEEGDPRRLSRSDESLHLMLRAIREGYRVLHAARIPITPAKHRIFEWLPERVIPALARRMVASDTTAIKIGHAVDARAEMKLLADEFRVLARQTSVPMPAVDRLYAYL